ncbi:MAG: SDR family oxidoreductase [Anaerolineae bacterium]|nr:SDR family oxidoreductase [Anaerolineae bacterium]
MSAAVSAGGLLVTGAAGFLGSEVVRRAVHDPRFAAVWGTVYSQPLAAAGVQAVPLDVTQRRQVHQVLADVRPQVVIHTAYNKRDEHLDAVVVAGTQHVAEAAALVGARLVHISTDLVLDGEHAPYDESAAPSPIHPYGRAKAAAEAIVRATAPNHVIVRTSLICGLEPMDAATRWIVETLRSGQPITLFTDELRNPVWVADLAAALLELAAGDFVGLINVAGPQVVSRYEMGLRLARHFGLDPSLIRPGLSRESGLIRPRDCRLDTGLARRLLRTRLRGYDEGFAD